jgi:exodeoxyribonuclease VII large subunit
VSQQQRDLKALERRLPEQAGIALAGMRQRLERAALRLELLDPTVVLQRGYAWLTTEDGRTLTSAKKTFAGQLVQATLADGTIDLTVREQRAK